MIKLLGKNYFCIFFSWIQDLGYKNASKNFG